MSTSRLVWPVTFTWFAGLTLYVLRTGSVSTEFALALFGGAAILCLLIPPRFSASARGLFSFFSYCLLLYFPIIVSAIFNKVDDSIIVNIVLLMTYSVLGWNFGRTHLSSVNFRVDVVRSFMSGTTIGVAAGFIVAFLDFGALAYGPSFWGRLSFNTHPNLVGLVALTGLMATPAVKSIPVKLVLIAVYAVIMNEAQSRMGIVAGLFAMGMHLILARDLRTYLARTGLIKVLIPVGLVVGGFAIPAIIQFLLSDVLLLNDAQRGIGSGLSGRDVLWTESLALFSEHPWFGVGYGEHGRILGIPYAHNMVIVLLADTGLFGFVTFLITSVLSCIGFVRSLRNEDSLALRVGLVFVLTYWVYGLGEGRALNVGNTLSILYVLTMFYGLAMLTVSRSLRGA